MRIDSIEVRNRPPVRYFSIDNLSDLVVLAGPNGVGKTRLIEQLLAVFGSTGNAPGGVKLGISSTHPDERTEWGKDRLDTSQNADKQILTRILNRQQRRGKWRNSAIHFDSSRQFQQVAVPSLGWTLPDPSEEFVSWNFLFGNLVNRFQDTVHAIYRKLSHHRASIATRAIELQKAGVAQMDLDFPDPLKSFKDAFSSLLAPKTLADIDLASPQLRYVSDGQLLDIGTLSSGEKEVLSVVFDLLLHAPEDCIIFIDEPELHLHPELSFRLLKTLQTIGSRNQLVLCTHSSDIISASIEHSVVFVRSPRDESNQAILIKLNDQTVTALRELGQSLGVISLGRKIVLIEGKERGLDKDTIGTIVQGRFPGLVLVPSGSRQTILSFADVSENVLDKTLWGIEFLMLADRDSSLPATDLSQLEKTSGGRLRFLPRYHVENYFLDEATITGIFREMVPPEHWLRNQDEIRRKLIRIARECVPLAVNLSLSTQIRTQIGEVDASLKGVVGMQRDEFVQKIVPRAAEEEKRINGFLDAKRVGELATQRWAELEAILDKPGDDWKREFPGKILVGRLVSEAGLDKGFFVNLYLSVARRDGLRCFQEIIDILNGFDALQR